ncbi:hypothetical protein D3C84_1310710 [compost metagenome]
MVDLLHHTIVFAIEQIDLAVEIQLRVFLQAALCSLLHNAGQLFDRRSNEAGEVV